MEIVFVIIGLICGVIIGWHIHSKIAAQILSDIMEVYGVSEQDLLKSLERIKNKQKDNVCNIRIEQDGDIFRAYRTGDDQFLAQADDVDELVDLIIRQVGKGVYVQCTLDNGGEIFRKHAENYQKNLH